MILVAYRHGLRATELTGLRWDSSTSVRAAPCPSPQEWPAERAHGARQRAARPAPAAARAGPPSPYLFTTERRTPMTAGGLPEAARGDRGGGRAPLPGPSPHAAPCLRLRPRQRQARHPRHPGVARAPQHPAHHPLHRAHHPPVQGLLATGRLTASQAGGQCGSSPGQRERPRSACHNGKISSFERKLA